MRLPSAGLPGWLAPRPRADAVARWPKRPGMPKRRIAVDHDTIRELTALLDETGLSEIEIEQDCQRVRVARNEGPSRSASAAPAPAMPANLMPSPAPIASGAIEPG